MQDINSSNKSTVLSSLTEGEAYYVRDSRDEEPYCVSKLKDGNLWMLDNLRLDLTNSTPMAALTTSNTNATETSLTSLRSGNRAEGNQYADGAFVAAWDSEHIANYYNRASVNAASKNTAVESYGLGSGKAGVYYNYCAASAGSYCYNSKAAPTDTNATQDICPAGWRMPTGNTSGEYGALLTAYTNNETATDTGSLQYALSTPLSGSFVNGSADYQSSRGYFWSSTRNDGSNMYLPWITKYRVSPQINIYRGYGISVRCLLQ